jgi:hypothetical protein
MVTFGGRKRAALRIQHIKKTLGVQAKFYF